MPNRRRRVVERSAAALERVDGLLDMLGAQWLVATRPGSVNWVSGGLSDPIDVTASSDAVWAVVSPERRVLVTTQIEAPRLERDFDVTALGWEVVAVPWYAPDAMVTATGRVTGEHVRVVSDSDEVGEDRTVEIVATRMVLSEAELADMRLLGGDAARALDAAIGAWEPGVSRDVDVAGELAKGIETVGAKSVCLIVGGDERLRRLRHPLAVGEVIEDAIMAVVVARRGGLHVAATRLAVRDGDDPIVALTHELAVIDDAVLAATSPAHTWGDVVEELGVAYRSAGYDGAWAEHYQGGPIAFEQREFELAPGQHESPFWGLQCSVGSAVAWNPSLAGGAKIEETYLIGETGLEPVTASTSGSERVKVVG